MTKIDRQEAAAPRFYRPELDVLRFVAFFSVFIAHLNRIPIDEHVARWKLGFIRIYTLAAESGAFGMCIFFLLSAYLITELLIRERAATGSVHLRAFYTRRILRIWPLYLGVVFAGYFIGFVVPEYRLTGAWVLAFVFLAANWYTGKVGYAPSSVGVLWSIALEEQFYLLWPGIAKFGGQRVLTAVAFLTVPIGYGVLFFYSARGEQLQPFLWTNSFVQFSFFGIGALLAIFLHRRPLRIPMLLRPFLLLGGVLLWFIANASFHVNEPFTGAHPFSMCFGFGLVTIGCVAVFFSLFGAPSSLLPGKLIYLGKISYGLYVFHVPCRELVRHLFGHVRHSELFQPVLTMALAVTVASLSYKYYEKPFLRLKEKFELVPSRRT